MSKGLDGVMGSATPGIQQGLGQVWLERRVMMAIGLPMGTGRPAATMNKLTMGYTLLGTSHLRSKQVVTLPRPGVAPSRSLPLDCHRL